MALFRSILCAVDHSELLNRVICHAAGLAGAAQAQLTVLTVVAHTPTGEDELTLERQYLGAVPYGTDWLSDPILRVETGNPVDAILGVAAEGADLIVAGSRGRGGLVRAMLGSTSASLLVRAQTPVLLVPPDDLDIVTLSHSGVMLHAGPVIAAIDLDESNGVQLAIAGAMAALVKQPLELLTIAGSSQSDHDAAQALRERARTLASPPRAFIVRRGNVAEEIGRAAIAEGSGLVVMGLRAGTRGTPGRIASSVLQTGRALVLAVPEQ